MVLYPNKLPESERVCSGICNSFNFYRYNLFLCLLEPVIECRVWNIVANAERVDGNPIGLTLGFVEEPQSFKIFFAKHNLSSFKFSTKVCERDMLVNTPILEAYQYFSIISNSVKPKVGWISEIFCILSISLLENFPRFGRLTFIFGGVLKDTKIN